MSRAVDEALAVVPSVLSPGVAVGRAEALLRLQDRVAALALRAVADVEERELWRVRAAGSTRTWLRTLPCGDSGQLGAARLLPDRPVLAGAFEAGDVSARTFSLVARELARVPAQVEPEQLQGVLIDGIGDLLGVWAGAACLDPTPAQEAEFEARREQLATVVRAGLKDCWGGPADQLEPVFVLAASVLAPAEVAAGLGLLVDALQPEADADARAEQQYRDRGLSLRKLKRGGWDLRAHLTDETGQRLYDELSVRDSEHPAQKARQTRAAAAASEGGLTVEDVFEREADDGRDETVEDVLGGDGHGAEDVFGQDADQQDSDGHGAVGPDHAAGGAAAAGHVELQDKPTCERSADNVDLGLDPDLDLDADRAPEADAERHGAAGAGVPLATSGRAVEGTPIPSRDQRAHDAFAQLLADLTTTRPGSGIPAPSSLTLTATLDALAGRPGAPPGRLVTGKGDVTLTPSQLRRHACGSVLSAVLLDARDRPVGASGTHRHASARERRAMRTAWGSTCAVNGCTLTATVPHHAEPWWKTQQTVLKDLVPFCEHHHHDLHDGSKTLRLRDGRHLDEWGWAQR